MRWPVSLFLISLALKMIGRAHKEVAVTQARDPKMKEGVQGWDSGLDWWWWMLWWMRFRAGRQPGYPQQQQRGVIV